MEIRFVPIEKWPGKFTGGRRPAPFRSGYAETRKLLEKELSAIRTRNAVVQLALPRDKISVRTGLPYANADPEHPGVILSFETPQPRTGHDPAKRFWTPLSFPCDTYSDWQDNLRAIALALEALRKVDRYGVTKTGEQYRGWSQLPPPGGGIVTPPPMTVEAAARVVAEAAGRVRDVGPGCVAEVLGRGDSFQMVYRTAAKAVHPDASGGQHLPEWDELQRAADVLRKHHGL